MSNETLKTPEAPVWLSSVWNNPTKTTLSENVFSSRLAEVKAMKWSIPDTAHQAMMQPFRDSFQKELRAGIAITSEADITRIEKMGLATGIDFSDLKKTLATLKTADDDLGYFRVILKSDGNWQISFKKNNSWIGHDKTAGQARNFGMGNYGTAVNYEVDFRGFPTKSEFRESGRDHIIAKLQSNTPEGQALAKQVSIQKQTIKEVTKTNISSVHLPVQPGQKVLLKAQDLSRLSQIIDSCGLGETCKRNNILDVVALQNAVAEHKPADYTGKKWDDGLFGLATYQAVLTYAKANQKSSTPIA
jgi:hypothetical protein